MSRQNQWFVPGNDIAREVITADIQRYLGPDALVRPGVGTGDYQGQPGYWITAYRTLTSQMIQDLRLDSQRWQAERQPEAGRSGGVAYQDSRTHAARQHWGPTAPYEQAQAAAQPQQPQHPQQQQYQSQSRPYDDRSEPKQSTRSSHANPGYSQYTTTPNPYEQSAYAGGQQAEPRTPQSYYPQSGRQAPTYQTSAQYPQQGAESYPSRTSTQPTNPYPQSQAEPGYYIASDGRQYPLSQQPTSQQRTGTGRGYTGRPGT